VHLVLSDEAREFVAREGYDPVFGARPLKRFLQHELETKIGRALVAGEVSDGSTVEVGLADGKLDVVIRGPEPEQVPTSG
jgi:ATP-dependent Clp protease ATP-binding subunit ClpB